MNTEKEIKEMVKAKYTEIALSNKEDNLASCCGTTNCSEEVYNIMTDSYHKMEGHVADADLGLGCGLPTEYAKIKKGDIVVDLGSGAGNDCFIARHETGESGKVIGVDFSEAMVDKARKNAAKMNYNNVEFRIGDIENMPLADDTADVIVSNCVLNLVPNKASVIKDIHRVLKPGGHFSISDIVLQGNVSENMRKQAEMYAGCVTGAIQKDEYLQAIKDQGFENIQLQKEKRIEVPRDILKKHLDESEVKQFEDGSIGIFSVTVFAKKAGGSEKNETIAEAKSEDKSCCGPECCS